MNKKNTNIVALIQARMSSTRLPGKVLMNLISEKNTLEIMINRVSKAKSINKIVVVTSKNKEDDVIEDQCKHMKVDCFRGSLTDVLDRYYQAAVLYGKPDGIVRLTADCPLHDPVVIDNVVNTFLNSTCDYVSNIIERTYPIGLDTEVVSFNALERMWIEAKDSYDREHVTTYIRSRIKKFKCKNVKGSKNYSHLRWTLDTSDDLKEIKAIFKIFNGDVFFTMDDIIKHYV